MSITWKNKREFTATLKRVSKGSRKPAANIVNKALKNVAFRAMEFTDYADPGLIEAQLLRDNIVYKIAARRVSSRAGSQKVDKFGNAKLSKKGRALKFSKKVTRNAIRIEAAKIIRKRKAGAKAIRAGWIPAVKKFGGSIRGGAKLKPGGTASKGVAVPATASKLRGSISNALVTISYVGKKTPVERLPEAVSGLNKAVAYVSKDMNSHQTKKEMEAMLRKHSDK